MSLAPPQPLPLLSADDLLSPGRVTAARAQAEIGATRAVEAATLRFLDEVYRAALRALDSPVIVASVHPSAPPRPSTPQPFTLGTVMQLWGATGDLAADALLQVALSAYRTRKLDTAAFLARVDRRLRGSSLPLDTFNVVRDILAESATAIAAGQRPNRTRVKARLRRALLAQDSPLRAQAERIARTETTAVFNQAVVQQLRDASVGFKRWVAHHDARTRPSHARASGQTVPVDEPFLVGGYTLSAPGDPDAPTSETANCRCVVTGVKDPTRGQSTARQPEPAAAPFVRNTDLDTFDYDGLGPLVPRTFGDDQDEALRAILSRQRMDGRPRVVSNEEFDKLAAAATEERPVMFRGFRERNLPSHGEDASTHSAEAEFAARWRSHVTAPHSETWIGTGGYGNGTYFLAHQPELSYVGDTGKTMQAVLDKDARVVTFTDLTDEMFSPGWAGWNISKEGQAVIGDPGRLAAVHGYDAIRVVKRSTGRDQWVILNRGALTVREMP